MPLGILIRRVFSLESFHPLFAKSTTRLDLSHYRCNRVFGPQRSDSWRKGLTNVPNETGESSKHFEQPRWPADRGSQKETCRIPLKLSISRVRHLANVYHGVLSTILSRLDQQYFGGFWFWYWYWFPFGSRYTYVYRQRFDVLLSGRRHLLYWTLQNFRRASKRSKRRTCFLTLHAWGLCPFRCVFLRARTVNQLGKSKEKDIQWPMCVAYDTSFGGV